MQFSRGIFNAFLRSAYIWSVKRCLHGHLAGRPCARLRMSKNMVKKDFPTWYNVLPFSLLPFSHGTHHTISFCFSPFYSNKKRNGGTEEELQKIIMDELGWKNRESFHDVCYELVENI